MTLFHETTESIAYAIVTIKRALKAGVIDKDNYKGLILYLNQRAADFKLKKSHIVKANRDLDSDLKTELEFYMAKGEALCNMAEELLEEHEILEEESCKVWENINKEREAASNLEKTL